MTRHVSQLKWSAQVAQDGPFDKITVQNLEVVVNAGKDVWGRQKKQRAFVSVTLTLGQQFESASSTDSVDNSTVHYGTLSKAVQAQLQDLNTAWTSSAELSASISEGVRKVAGSTRIYAIETDVCYLKGSMFGDGAGYIVSNIEDSGLNSRVLYLRNVRIPCLIGVNSNERLQKQPVVVNLWVDGIPNSRVDEHAALETFLYQLVSESSFQTIESLSAWMVEEFRKKYFTREEDQDVWIRLKIEKPMAVPFADAPAVEVTRPIKASQK